MPSGDTLTLEARVENLDQVLAFVDAFLEAEGCSPRVQMQIDVAVEEIFVNIASYAYSETDSRPASIGLQREGDEAVITLIDSGRPYDPLARPDPDVTLPASERPIGGLGIYMVKKSMDGVTYARQEGENILTLRKRLN